MVKTSGYLKNSTTIDEMAGFLSLCHCQPGSSTSKRLAAEIVKALLSANIHTVGEFMAHSQSFYDGLDHFGPKQAAMLCEAHEYLISSGIGEEN